MSRFITDQVGFRCFFYKNFRLPYSKSYICKRLTAFISITQLKASWIYLDIAAFQHFKVFLLLPHACEDFGKFQKLEFRLNCKQRLAFLPGPTSDNRFMSVDAA